LLLHQTAAALRHLQQLFRITVTAYLAYMARKVLLALPPVEAMDLLET
jgi:hypothetical protein